MAPKVKAAAGCKAKAKAATKEEAKKTKVVKAATKGKHISPIKPSNYSNLGRFLISD